MGQACGWKSLISELWRLGQKDTELKVSLGHGKILSQKQKEHSRSD